MQIAQLKTSAAAEAVFLFQANRSHASQIGAFKGASCMKWPKKMMFLHYFFDMYMLS
jgi:hypothetical protein